ncbi:hypothetical protein [Chryseobacterium polytrichastri]|uniref:Uncharacterized protein n=1 Tax=Chryseobacterium polytrichastri TaxID=1302687 RepID=A0A1M6TZW9_9FLAO|nr:hypothetical protein [Chryseobacterium polytrichastri]SHK62496.1 hypothetical protein SAMN05444267_10063 [Chryseobacterium polytrichastri]
MTDFFNFDEKFKVGTKVFIHNEYGVIIDFKEHGLSTVIRWDTLKENDFEDWFSMWGTFFDMGGEIINKNHQFKYINDDGSLKDKI